MRFDCSFVILKNVITHVRHIGSVSDCEGWMDWLEVWGWMHRLEALGLELGFEAGGLGLGA